MKTIQMVVGWTNKIVARRRIYDCFLALDFLGIESRFRDLHDDDDGGE